MSSIVIIHAGMSEESSTAKLARDIRKSLVTRAPEAALTIEHHRGGGAATPRP